MSIQALRQGASRNPRTVEEARAFVLHVESLFMPWNIDALVDGFTEDCVVRFGTVPEFRGRDSLRAFFMARSAKQKGYRLKKEFRTLMNDTLTNARPAGGRQRGGGCVASPGSLGRLVGEKPGADARAQRRRALR